MDQSQKKTPSKSQLMYDHNIIPRVKQYLEENVHQRYLDVGVMARMLQERYREYSRRKSAPFRQLVEQAYRTVLHSYGLDSNPSSDADEDPGSDLEVMEDRSDPMNSMLTHMYMNNNSGNKSSGGGTKNDTSSADNANAAQAAPLPQDSNELIDISSDEDVEDTAGDHSAGSKPSSGPAATGSKLKTGLRHGQTIITVVPAASASNSPAAETTNAPDESAAKMPAAKKRKVQPLEQPRSGLDAIAEPVQTLMNPNNQQCITDSLLSAKHVADLVAKLNVLQPQSQRRPLLATPAPVNGAGSAGGVATTAKSASTAAGSRRATKRTFAVTESTLLFEDVGGMDRILKELCELLLHIKHPEVYRHIGLPPPRGFLLHGPPGCGKTLLAQAIAGQLDVSLIQVAATELVAGVSGESEERIRELFEQAAALAPCVLFIDEIDAISSNRQNAQKDMERRIVSQLLASLDGLASHIHGNQVLIIGATNRADTLDPALRRVGRFDQEISLGIPDRAAREHILRVICADLKLKRPFDFDWIAALTPGYVGADLLALATRAASIAVKRAFTAKADLELRKQRPDPPAVVQTVSLLGADDEPTEVPEPTAISEPVADSVVSLLDELMDTVEKETAVETTAPVAATPAVSSADEKIAANEAEPLAVVCDVDVASAPATESVNGEPTAAVAVPPSAAEAMETDDQPEAVVGESDANEKKDNDAVNPSDDSAKTGDDKSDTNNIVAATSDETTVNISTNTDADEQKNTTTVAASAGEALETTTATPAPETATVAPPSDSATVAPAPGTALDTLALVSAAAVQADAVQADAVAGAAAATANNDEIVDLSDDETLDEALLRNPTVRLSLTLDEMVCWLSAEEPIIGSDEIRDLRITMADFCAAVKLVQPSAKREGFITVPDVTWADIGALRDIREELQLAVLAPVRYPHKLEALGLKSPSGVLLCGPPGCGKTLLAKAVANEAGINFISVKGPELLNMYVGESERAVRQCFQRARNSAPCVIFFDEFDALCPTRSGSSENTSSSRVVNQLLTEMDGVEERKGVFLMAATNRPDIVDPAVLRPGRLDKILYVGLPGQDERAEILEALTKTKPKLAADVSCPELAKLTENFTGADLAGLVRQASLQALKESIATALQQPEEKTGNKATVADLHEEPILVQHAHFVRALSQIRPSVSEEDKRHYLRLQKKYTVMPTAPAQ